jgi:fatty acid desaturase
MSNQAPDDIDRAAIAENAQRTVERSALRKVRKALDSIERAQADKRKLLRNVLLACAALALVGAWLVWTLIISGREPPVGPGIELPAAAKPKQ